eukprot:m.85307 g.85307  ORF g.85307 m.85307 type:complete len:100 (+) comp8379_c0_seq1:384-683(+)
MAFLEGPMRVKHLNGTSSCRHYRGLGASYDSGVKCATNGCQGRATRACHVIFVNQPHERANRYIVYCCPTCNGQKLGQISTLRRNAQCFLLSDCRCGVL